MKTATLHRLQEARCGTFGRLTLDGRGICFTLELGWRDNRNNVSCIPPGRYEVEWIKTPRHGWCYHVKGVPGRFAILIHSANLAGDTTIGCKTHLLGCIAPGLKIGHLGGQIAVLNSATAVRKLADLLDRQSFILDIKGVRHV